MNGIKVTKRNFIWILVSSSFLIQSLTAPVVARAQGSAEDNYNKKCAVCHAKDGSGNTAKGKKVHVKSARENMSHSDAEMIKVVTEGKGEDMDAYKQEFTPEQIKALVDYYRGLGAK